MRGLFFVFCLAACASAGSVVPALAKPDASALPPELALFRGSCDGGSAEACQSLGAMYAIGGAGDGSVNRWPIDLARSFAAHERACEMGLADGCMSVAYMYEHGEHVAVDLALAAAMYERACQAGSGDGCYGLAQLYADGRGVGKEARKARGLLERGCKGNGPYACYALAQAMYDGASTAKDACCTVALLLRACARQHPQACAAAGLICGAEPAAAGGVFRRVCPASPPRPDPDEVRPVESTFRGCEFLQEGAY